MLYLLAVLTFLAGIFFYGMSPRDDQMQLQANQAEGMVLPFLNQHQAARDYLYTWLGASEKVSAAPYNIEGNVINSCLSTKTGLNIHPLICR